MSGVYFDNKLSFTSHVTKWCIQAGQKLHALARISTFMSLQQRKTIMNTFIQFGYCPLICHSRSLNSRINRIHERTLIIIYNDSISSFEKLLEISGSVTNHVRNLQGLATEIYKALNTSSSPLVSELFQIKDMMYNLCKGDPLLLTMSKQFLMVLKVYHIWLLKYGNKFQMKLNIAILWIRLKVK